MRLSRYAGGKYFARKQIFEILKAEAITCCDDWIEPFVGAGSILFQAMRENIAQNYYANDINSDIINVYKNFNAETISKFLALGEEYLSKKDNIDMYIFFKNILKQYNDAEEKAGHLFLFLVNFCYGGVVRYSKNKKLDMTANYGINRNLFLENRRKMYEKMCELIQTSNVNFFNCDYRDFLKQVIDKSRGQVIFLDPPYESDTMSYNADKIGSYNAVDFLQEFRAFKNETNLMLITIRAKESDIVRIFDGYDLQIYKLNIDKRLNNKFNRGEKIDDCLIIVR